MSHYHEAAIKEAKLHRMLDFIQNGPLEMRDAKIKKVVAILNRAFRSDPRAVEALVRTSVPCGLGLAVMDHIVNEDERGRHFKVTSMGLLNGVLGPLLGSIVVVLVDDQNEMSGFGWQKSYSDE